MSRKLLRSFYTRPTLEVARDLLGGVITFRTKQTSLSAHIVEVEAYIGQDDPACHAARGLTERNRVMFGRPGFSYVYFIYGMYHCFNIVTESKGFPAAILVRAAEPIDGIELMRERSPKGKVGRVLSGPGKFCRSFGLSRDHSGVDLTGSTLYLTEGEGRPGRIMTSGRMGIKVGTELPYRFYLADSKAVSGTR
jgi:DNA-3-methyladenine glycosylase